MKANLERRHTTLYTRAFAAAFAFIMLLPGVLYSCSFAKHQWELVTYKTFETQTPIFPLAEADMLLSGKFSPAKFVLWVTPKASDFTTQLVSYLVPYYYSFLDGISLFSMMIPNTKEPFPSYKQNIQWCKNLQWIPVQKGAELKQALNKLGKNNCIVIGSDQAIVKAAIFSDKLSDYNCRQVILSQTGRVRGIQMGSSMPVATEQNGIAYSSVVYYGSPFNKDVMSFSVYPFAGIRAYTYQDEDLTSNLIAWGRLFPQDNSVLGGEGNDVPSIPD